VFKPLKTTHQRYAEVFGKLGFPINLDDHSFPQKISLSPNIVALSLNSSKKWLGIAPFAQYESKTYPVELMIEVIETLDRENQFEIFLFGGGKREKDILNNIASKYNNVINVVGKLPFEDELKLIGNLDVMLSMDSGNAHIAAMYNVPTITLWGVTHPFAGFMPFGQPVENAPTSIYDNKVPEGYEKVMYSIPPKTVVEKLNSFL